MRIRTQNNVFRLVIVLPLLGLLLPFGGKAQLEAPVYEEFSQTILNPYIINPSAIDTNYSIKVRFNNVSEIGLFKGVNRFYLDADKKFGSSKKERLHYGGIQLTSSRLGEYIRKNRVQLRYSLYTQLSKKTAVSAGISFGLINYSFQTTQGGSGGSDTGPDGAFGLHLLRNKFAVGVSVQQLFPTVLQPIDKTFEFNRLYNFDVQRIFFLSPQFNLNTQVVFQLKGESNYAYSFNCMLDYNDRLFAGVSDYSLKKTSVNLGLKQAIFSYYDFSFFVAYTFFHSSIPLSDNTLELFFSFSK